MTLCCSRLAITDALPDLVLDVKERVRAFIGSDAEFLNCRSTTSGMNLELHFQFIFGAYFSKCTSVHASVCPPLQVPYVSKK